MYLPIIPLNELCLTSDDNEYSRENADCSHECNNFAGYYYCACSEGYMLDIDMHGSNNVNECLTDNKCAHTCVDTSGSYYCVGRDGFEVEPNRVLCDDIDECSTPNHNCSHFCKNTIGSYACFCPSNLALAADDMHR